MAKNIHEDENVLFEEKNKISEAMRLFLVNVIYMILANITKIEISQTTLNNLQELDKQLNNSSVVLYGYHSSLFDALVLPIILSQQLNNVDKMIAPVAITHAQGLQKVFLNMMSLLTNAQFPPIIREKDQPNYDLKLKRQLLKQLIEITKESLTEPGNIYGVAPMGTRGKILKSDQVNPGFISVAQKYDVPMLPIAFSKNTAGSLEFKVGQINPPPDSKDNIADSINFYMKTLADLLPKELRGVYS